MLVRSIVRNILLVFVLVGLVGCAAVPSPPHLKPLPAELRATLAKKGMEDSAPIFIRIIKEESLLEVWKAKADGRYYHLKSYPVCKWSGTLGPKLKQGDKQAPEGFYNVVSGNMNPKSKYHLSFNLGYPNVYDRAHGRTGKHLMVHGDCKSAGCYAMTDALMEEIYLLARDAFIGGQDSIPVHAFPFRLTNANLHKHRQSRWYRFWRSMKEGYNHFEVHKTLPKVDVCNKRYLINASFIDPNGVVDPTTRCPRYRKFVPGVMPLPRQIMAKAPAPAPARTPVMAAGMAASPTVLPTASVAPQPVAAAPTVSAPAPVIAAPEALTYSPQAPLITGPTSSQVAAGDSVAQPAPTSLQRSTENRSVQTSLDDARAIMFGDNVGMQPTPTQKSQFEDLINQTLTDNR